MPEQFYQVYRAGQGDIEGGIQNIVDNNPVGPIETALPGPINGWIIGPSSIYNPNDPSDYLDLSTTGSNRLSISDDQIVTVFHEVSTGYLNRSVSTRLQYGVQANGIEYIDPDGNVQTFDVDFAPIADKGYRRAIFQLDDGSTRMYSIRADISATEARATYMYFQRFARPEEVIQASLTGAILSLRERADAADRAKYDEIVEYAREELEMDTETDYEVIAALASNLQTSVVGVARQWVS